MDSRFKKAFSASLALHLALVVYSVFFAKEIDNETIFVEIANQKKADEASTEETQPDEISERKNQKNRIQKNRKNNTASDFLSGFKKGSLTTKNAEDVDAGRPVEKKRSFYRDSEKKTDSDFLSQKNDLVKEKKVMLSEEQRTVWKSGKTKREIVYDPPLHFPPSIKNLGVSARVKVKAMVDPDGRVFGVEFIHKSGFSGLDLSVSKHIRSMRFGKIEKNENSEFSREYFFKLKSNSE